MQTPTQILKMIVASTALAIGTQADLVNIGQTADGGLDGTQVSNWTTDNTAFIDSDPGPSNLGLAFNWENVTANTATIDVGNNEFDYDYQANVNHTIGHGFLFNETFDLSSTTAGIEGLTLDFDFNSSTHNNWSPLISVTAGASTTYYRWNHSNNSFRDTNAFSVGDVNLNAANTTWGELVDTTGGFSTTRLDGTNPNLQATSGTVQFGFLQWGASTGNGANSQGSNVIDAINFGVTFTPVIPEPGSLGLVLLGGLTLVSVRKLLPRA